MDTDKRDEQTRTYEHLWLSDLRKHPSGDVRLFAEDGKLISGTYAFQVTSSIDAMARAATGKPRTITTVEELRALSRGAVLVSDYWTDAFSYIGGADSPTTLMNVATGHRTSVAEADDFFPATVVYEFDWSKRTPQV